MNIKFGFRTSLFWSAFFNFALTLSIVTLLTFNFYTSDKTTSIDERNAALVNVESERAIGWFGEKVTTLNRYIHLLESKQDLSIEQYTEILSKLVYKNDFIQFLVVFDDGASYSSDQQIITNSEQYKNSDWYKTAVKDKLYISPILNNPRTNSTLDNTQGNLISYIAIPIQGGVLRGMLSLNKLSQIVQKESLNTVHRFLLDDQFNVIITGHDSIVKVGDRIENIPSLSPLLQALQNKPEGMVTLNLKDNTDPNKNINLETNYNTITLPNGAHWHFVITSNRDILYSALNQAYKINITIYLLAMIWTIFAAYIMIKWLCKPIDQLLKYIKTLSSGNGDLTQKLPEHDRDELGKIAYHINKFISHLRELMLELSDTNKNISDNILKVKAQTVTNNAILDNHAKETEKLVIATDEMSSTSSLVSQNSEEAARYTKQSHELSIQSKLIVDKTNNSVVALIEEVNDMAISTQKLSEDTKDIEEVLSVIQNIAEQTNLLALNAAIEAARAGNHGLGFAVVADEVRALAVRTRQSTSEINDMLQKLREGSKSVVEAMDKTKQSCEEVASNTENVTDNLNQLSDSVAQINILNTHIATAARQQSVASEEINENLNSINQMAINLKHNARQTVDISEELTTTNQQLMDIFSKFKLH